MSARGAGKVYQDSTNFLAQAIGSILPDLIANNRNALPVTYFVHRNGFCLISGCLDMQLEYVA